MRVFPRSSSFSSTAFTKLLREAGCSSADVFKTSAVAKCSSRVIVRMDSDFASGYADNSITRPPFIEQGCVRSSSKAEVWQAGSLASRLLGAPVDLRAAAQHSELQTNYGLLVLSLMDSNSTSKMSVVLGPITLPAPRSP